MLLSAGENWFGNILNQESDIYTGGQDSYQDQLTLQLLKRSSSYPLIIIAHQSRAIEPVNTVVSRQLQPCGLADFSKEIALEFSYFFDRKFFHPVSKTCFQ